MDIQLPQILFQIINFSVVAGALTYLLYKPVQKIMSERAARIEEGQKAAEKALTEQQQAEELTKTSKKTAEKEAATIIAEAKKTADRLSQEIQVKTQEHAKAQLMKFQSDWQGEKKKLVEELKHQFADSVVAAAEKVVGNSFKVDQKAQSKLIDEELEQLLKKI